MKEACKIPKKYWISSKDKWIKTIELTKAGKEFNDEFGFANLKIKKKCGYCEWFLEKNTNPVKFNLKCCVKCNLHKIGICDIAYYKNGNTTPFWQYMRKMWEGKNDEALPYAEQILKAIMEDEVNVIEDE